MKIFSREIALVLLLLSFSSYSRDGTINFTGYIYQSACSFDIHKRVFNCPHAIRTAATQSWHQLTSAALPADFGTSHMNWLDTTHLRGIMTLSYR